GVSAGRKFHDDMVKGVMYAPVPFFDRNPVGRILNRFSSDLDTLERQIPWSFEATCRSIMQVVLLLLLVVAYVPVSLLAIVPSLFAYYHIQRTYRTSGREAQRLHSMSRSPKFALLKEAVLGAVVVRSFNSLSAMENEFMEAARHSVRMFHGLVVMNRWFSIRIPLVASSIGLSVTTAAVLATRQGAMGAGSAGLLVMYGMRFWDSLNWAVRSYSQLEAQMTSVERVARFSTIETEDDGDQNICSQKNSDLFSISRSRSRTGGADLEFRDLWLGYGLNQSSVLKGVNIHIKSGQRIGIIGKTGAGKSSIISALFGFYPLTSGEILIDGIPSSQLSTMQRRSMLCLIPQDPLLFIGTFRSNLDPFQQYSDHEIWAALERVGLNTKIRTLPNKLEAIVSENGINLSQGERQLVCFARAILTLRPESMSRPMQKFIERSLVSFLAVP
ncbi:MAG: ATP-binding cassette domain-containing protein, partial [Proteobacteria bacterium]|nr:ATP-binding cassette domain-containing protein [Pseudomonadota bacterium]